MKRLLLIVLAACFAFASPLLAGDKDEKLAYGTIEKMDATTRTLFVRGDDGKAYDFVINPTTEIEIKHKYWFDTDGNESDLTAGEWVAVEYKMTSPTYFVAKEIKLYRK